MQLKENEFYENGMIYWHLTDSSYKYSDLPSILSIRIIY